MDLPTPEKDSIIKEMFAQLKRSPNTKQVQISIQEVIMNLISVLNSDNSDLSLVKNILNKLCEIFIKHETTQNEELCNHLKCLTFIQYELLNNCIKNQANIQSNDEVENNDDIDYFTYDENIIKCELMVNDRQKSASIEFIDHFILIKTYYNFAFTSIPYDKIDYVLYAYTNNQISGIQIYTKMSEKYFLLINKTSKSYLYIEIHTNKSSR